jgi:serine/threonine-protein kinase
LINTVVGDFYLIEQQLGRDQFGYVYHGRDTRWRTEHKPVAIRILDNKLSDLPGFAERFAEVAPKLVGWDQLYINRVLAQGVIRNTSAGTTLYYLVSEPPAPETLFAYLQRARSAMSVENIAALVEQIGAAIEYAHRHNVIHGNLNLWNITMRDEVNTARPEIADFGLIQMLTPFDLQEQERLTGWKVPIGVPEFIAPERFRGEAPAKSNDVYVFGVLLYYILSGRMPFTGTYDQLIVAHSYQNPPSLGPLVYNGPQVHQMLIRALSKAPLDRFSVQEVCIRFRNINSLPRMMLPVFDTHAARPAPPSETGELKKKGFFGFR